MVKVEEMMSRFKVRIKWVKLFFANKFLKELLCFLMEKVYLAMNCILTA